MDWWAIGVILYEFIVGIPPFNDDSVPKIWKNITNRKIEWPQIGYDEDCMSPEAKDLICRLLEPDQNKRIKSLKEFVKHPFFNGINFNNINNEPAPCLPTINFQNFCQLMKLEGQSFQEIFKSEVNKESKTHENRLSIKDMHMVRNDLLHEQNLEKLQRIV